MPVTEEIDAEIGGAADACEGEEKTAEYRGAEVFVVGTCVDGGGEGKGGACGVDEEGGEVVVGLQMER